MTYIPDSVFPSGMLMYFCGIIVPNGWLWCYGQAISRTDYGSLFDAIQITYGPGDGVNTFNVPDCRGRVIIGAGSGPGLSTRTAGQIGGEENHILTKSEIPPHVHRGITRTTGDADSGNTYNYSSASPEGEPLIPRFNTTDGSEGGLGGGSHNNMQPYLVVGGMLIKI